MNYTQECIEMVGMLLNVWSSRFSVNGDQETALICEIREIQDQEKYQALHCNEIPTFFINVFIFACKQILGFTWRECFFGVGIHKTTKQFDIISWYLRNT